MFDKDNNNNLYLLIYVLMQHSQLQIRKPAQVQKGKQWSHEKSKAKT
jgi:hypothetical protein